MENKKKTRILFIVNALGYSGVGKMITCLANHVYGTGYEVAIYVQEQTGQHYPVESGIEIIQETHFYANYYTRRFQQIGQTRRRIAEVKPDLVISFQTNQNALAILATRSKGIPVIISERGDPYQYRNLIAKMKNCVINRAEGGVFQTQRAREYFGKGLQRRSRVINNPCTVPREPAPSWDARRNEIVFVARFDIQQKRQDLMVDAFSQIAGDFPEMKLGFYGIGDDESVIRKQVAQLGLTDRVIFHGLERDIPNAIRNAKLFVLTSDYEGMPNALIEAMAVGLPCLSTDCSPGGAAELIRSGTNGIIVPVGDVSAIAEGMRKLLRDSELAQTMGQKAQEITDRMRPEIIYQQWIDYIEQIISS